MKKKSKKPGETIETTPEYDSVRETAVLLGEIKDQVSLVAEQHGSIIEKLKEHDGKFEMLGDKMDNLNDKIMANSYKIDRVEKKLDDTVKRTDQRIKKVEEKVGL